MNRSLALVSALTLSSTALITLQPQEAKAMNIAFDCFERSSEKLVARSAVDITSTSISCLPVPGTTLAEDSSSDSEGEDLLVDNVAEDDGWEQDDWEDDPADDIADNGTTDEDDSGEDDGETNSESSTGSRLGDAVGNALGDLIGKGLADLLR
jgi:hypothetical protein